MPRVATRRPTSSRTIAQQLRPLARIHSTLRTRGYASVDVERARERIERGRPGFGAAAVLRSTTDLRQAFDRTAAAFERAGLVSTSRIEAFRNTTLDTTALVVAWANSDSRPSDPVMRMARRLAALVGNAVLSRVACDVISGADLTGWRWAECPCCGASPDLALSTETGRMLVCWRCDTRWPSVHLGCLSCGAATPPTIARIPSPYLGYELAICNSCGRYLKERKGTPLHDLLIERAIVSGLDDAAQQRGLRA